MCACVHACALVVSCTNLQSALKEDLLEINFSVMCECSLCIVCIIKYNYRYVILETASLIYIILFILALYL